MRLTGIFIVEALRYCVSCGSRRYKCLSMVMVFGERSSRDIGMIDPRLSEPTKLSLACECNLRLGGKASFVFFVKDRCSSIRMKTTRKVCTKMLVSSPKARGRVGSVGARN